MHPNSIYGQPNFVKLQDFNKRIYVVGVFDDPLLDMIPLDPKDRTNLNHQLFDKSCASTDQEKMIFMKKVAQNIKLIRDVVKEFRPEQVILEMCDDRNERWL